MENDSGAALVGAGAVLDFLDESGILVGGRVIAQALYAIGGPLGLVGLRHAIAKQANGGGK